MNGVTERDEWNGILRSCTLCPVECGANRLERVGACGVSGISVAKYYLHPFEEPCVSFEKGSGTIFFTGCNLRCPFCQNYELSRAERGKPLTPHELADIFKLLEDQGAENISLVTPTHVLPYLVRALRIYKPKIPVVYNTGGYEKVSALEAIDEFVDIYLPDLKFYSPTLSKRYLGREDYFDIASEAIEFMAKKPLNMTSGGKLLSGLIVRHLVMPLCSGDSKAIVKWFANRLPKTAYLSLMRQYTPFGDIEKYPELSRRITAREYDAVVDTALACGVEKLFVQDADSAKTAYIPSWDF
ncbi:MAG: radical SAM protein [Clostridia bacterium]|nr:radical SAM protein [Clostridia bacterium]